MNSDASDGSAPSSGAPVGGGTGLAPVRALGRWTLAALVVNAVVGSGVFALPATVARLVGPAAPWAWIVGALGNGVVMLCFAEVASRFTASGGAYLYARAALSRPVAILVGWLAWVTRVTAAAAGANLFTVNLAALVPSLGGRGARLALLALLLVPLTIVNVRGVRGGARWSNVSTVAKLAPLAILLVAGALWIFAGDGVGAPDRAAAPLSDWLKASLLIAFGYGGYDGALMAMGEAKNPRRDAPFALLVAMLFLAGLYTAIQLVVDGVLADPGASERPLADAAAVVLGPWGGTLLAAAAVVSIAGYLGANFLNAPRLAFALAEHGDLPAVFGRIHPRFLTPDVAIAIFGASVLGLSAWGNFEWNATLSAVSRLLVYGATCVALLVLRRRDPGGASFRLPGGALVPILGVAFCAVLTTTMGRTEAAMLAAFAALSALHWLAVRRRGTPEPS